MARPPTGEFGPRDDSWARGKEEVAGAAADSGFPFVWFWVWNDPASISHFGRSMAIMANIDGPLDPAV